jgi:prepilin-type N-terminal cleavage/methylation domain-containing protein
MIDDKGMTLPEVLIAIAILTIGLLAVVSMLSSGFSDVVVSGGQSKATSYARQKVEELRNQPFVVTLAQQTDTPETGVTRTWQIAQVGATVTPNRLARITVTVTWTGGSTGGQQVILETMRSE